MQRPKYQEAISKQFRVHTACGLLGPRQVGKTTLAKMYIESHPPEHVRRFDLENPLDLTKLENPLLTLSKPTQGLIVIDEIQLRPDLFPVLRVLIDENRERKFLILGSASRDLIRQSSETLAGRIGYIELMPFSLEETNNSPLVWLRGGFPLSFLAQDDEMSFLWRQSYITTFLERDIPSLGFQIPPQQIRRFWLMLAHYHGQIFNASEIAKSLGISDHTVRRYLDILAGTFMVRILSPWFENLGKRQVKSPKIYFRDSGILHALLGIRTEKELDTHPKLGAFWEGFALEAICQQMEISPEECFFWKTQSGAELDLLTMKNGKRIGFEIKYTDQPAITRSMRIACEDLKLDHLYIVFPGKESFPLDDKISARGLLM
ncbi:MAG: ATP-binding protein [Verrucomicrobia bacterium]|nr:ATP-binding protein [Verrucomicrobiota bacterium]